MRQALQGAAWAHAACHGDMETDSLVLAAPTGDDNNTAWVDEKRKRLELELLVLHVYLTRSLYPLPFRSSLLRPSPPLVPSPPTNSHTSQDSHIPRFTRRKRRHAEWPRSHDV